MGSSPIDSTMVFEVKAVETLVCGTSQSGFKSRQAPLGKMPLNGQQLVLKTRVWANCRGSIPPSSFYALEGDS